MPVEMDIDTGVFRHDGLDCSQILVHPIEVLLLVPNIPVHLLLKRGVCFVGNLGTGLRTFSLQGVPAKDNLLGVICARRERRVDIDEVNLHAFVFQIGAGRKTFTANDKIVRIAGRSDMFTRPHLVERHSTAKRCLNRVVPIVAKRTGEVVQYRLPFDGLGEKRNKLCAHFHSPDTFYSALNPLCSLWLNPCC